MRKTPTRPKVLTPRFGAFSSGGTGLMMLAEYLSSDEEMLPASPVVQMLASRAQRAIRAGAANVIHLFGGHQGTSVQIPQKRQRSFTKTRVKRRKKNAPYSRKYAELHWLRFPKQK